MSEPTYEIVELDGLHGVVHVAPTGEAHVIDVGPRGTFASPPLESIHRHASATGRVAARHAAAGCDVTPFVEYLRDRSGDGHRFGDLHATDPRDVAYGIEQVREALASALTHHDAFRVASNFVDIAEISGDMQMCRDFEPLVEAYLASCEDPLSTIEAAGHLETLIGASAPAKLARIEAWREGLDAEAAPSPGR